MPTLPLDPQVAELQQLMRDAGLDGFQTRFPVQRSRAQAVAARTRFYPQIGLPILSIADIEIPGPGGPIPARVVRPRDVSPPMPTVMYYHGGGFTLGDLDSHEGHARRVAERTGSVVVNVGYRLAPEHPFPAAVDDALAALQWAVANIGRLGGDLDAVGVAGDSAGGNLAAVTAVSAVEAGIALAGQLLLYPATDMSRSPDTELVNAYLGDDHEDLARESRASPLFAPRLSDVAPIVLGVGEHDFLYEDNLAFLRRLEELGVPHRARIYPTLAHSFFSYVSVSRASELAADEVSADFRALLRPNEGRV